jgi:hypothetical protein
MNDVWTTEELVALRSELIFQRDLRVVAAMVERPVSEVEKIAHDMGWMRSPPFTPDETKCGD